MQRLIPILCLFVITGCNYRLRGEIDDINNIGVYVAYNEYLDSLQREYPFHDFSEHAAPSHYETNGTDIKRHRRRFIGLGLKDKFIAFKTWKRAPWSRHYDFDVFRKYVCDVHIYDEPEDYTWRAHSYRDWKTKALDEDVICRTKAVLDNTTFRIFSMFRGLSAQPYAFYYKYKRGTCKDQCVYYSQILRAQGIPVAIDYIPSWGNHNLGHMFNSVILPDNSSFSFNDKKDLTEGFNLTHKVPKVYRLSPSKCGITDLAGLVKEDIPASLHSGFLEDITNSFNVPLYSVKIRPESFRGNLLYLAVPHFASWRIVSVAHEDSGEFCFDNLGAGYLDNQSPSDYGEFFGDGILYLPVSYSRGVMKPESAPFILSSDGEIIDLIAAESYENMTVTRKYPKYRRVIENSKTIEGCILEVSDDRDFSDAKIIGVIKDVSEPHSFMFQLSETQTCRFVRLRKPRGGFSLSELYCICDNKRLPSTPFSITHLEEESLSCLVDGDCLTFFNCEGPFHDMWVGLDFGIKRKIESLEICPRTDDNGICPGDEYELLSWNNNSWVPVEKKTADEYSLEFSHVRVGALHLLRNNTKGSEIRPFTYENGHQVWW